jgi:hypothetical protein
MSGVDVLARIEHAADVMYAGGMGTVTILDLREASAAVAELIEAAEQIQPWLLCPTRKTSALWMTTGDRRRASANDALKAAIAACKGGEP